MKLERFERAMRSSASALSVPRGRTTPSGSLCPSKINTHGHSCASSSKRPGSVASETRSMAKAVSPHPVHDRLRHTLERVVFARGHHLVAYGFVYRPDAAQKPFVVTNPCLASLRGARDP